MSEQAGPIDQEQIKEWIEHHCHELARRLSARGVLKGTVRVESRWVLPGQVMIGVAQQKDKPRPSMWVIGGEVVTPDAVDIGLARNPREAARHFSLRWQLSGARMGTAAEGEGGHEGMVDWKGIEQRLSQQAEMLHRLAEDERAWKNTQDEPGAGKKLK